jgi:RNA polymerase sigma-70 factor (ECF subfamily)
MDESQALSLCQQGDMSAFTQLYDLYVSPIYRFIFYKVRHKETSEDLTSTTFIKALENIKKFDSNKASFKTWLYQIARHSVIDHYRTFHPLKNIEDAWDLHSDDDPEKKADVALKLEAVKKVLAELSAEQREVVMLRVWGDLGFKEIAQITGKSEAACKMSFKRTVEKLGGNFALFLLLFYLH